MRHSIWQAVFLLSTSLVADIPGAFAWVTRPPLTADPKDIILTSTQYPPVAGTSVQELLEETLVRIDDQGRRSFQYRYVFRIDHESAIEGWSAVSGGWSSWFENRPEIRARVVSPRGEVQLLDSATLGEYGVEDSSNQMYGDRKSLKGPLPKLSKGCIVEIVLLQSEHTPFSRAGVQGLLTLAQQVPVAHTRIEVQAPESAGLKVKIQGRSDLSPTRSTRQGLTTVSLELGPQPGLKLKERGLPQGVELTPVLAYSTVDSWDQSAKEYSAMVESRLKGTDWAPMLGNALEGATTREEKIRRLVRKLHQEIRYTGLEFGAAAIVPAPPSEVLKRGYGDCKDKATYLVGLLRAAGIQAHVALLWAGEGRDVDPDVPGMSLFNHAIVCVSGPDPLWIDATAEFAHAGDPVKGVEGRWALVAAAEAGGLRKIPEVTPTQNIQREIREIHFAEQGRGSLVETTHANGLFEQRYRATYGNRDDKGNREGLMEYVKGALGAEGIERFSHTPVQDLEKPFELVLEVQGTTLVNTEVADAAVRVNPWSLVAGLQDQIKGLTESEGDSDPVRTLPLRLSEPYTKELVFQIAPLAGYQAEVLPAPRTISFGPATMVCNFQRWEDGGVQASFMMVTGPRTWSPEEVNGCLKAIKAFGEEQQMTVVFSNTGESHLAAGRIKDALREFKAHQKRDSAKAMPHLRMARAYLEAGLGEAAREAASAAVKLESQSGNAYFTYGWVMQHDLAGRRFGSGWDRDAALKAYRKAKELDPKNWRVRADLAILLEHNAAGERYEAGSDLTAAAAEYAALAADLNYHNFDTHRLIVLCKLGRFAEAVSFGKGIPASPLRDNWLVVALVRELGLENGISEATRLLVDPKSRRAAFLEAAEGLLRSQKYPEALRLLREGAVGSEQMSQLRARAELWERLRMQESGGDLREDPAAVARRLMFELLGPKVVDDRIKPFLSPALKEFLPLSHFRSAAETLQEVLKGKDLPVEVIRDFILSLVQISVEEQGPLGSRVTCRSFDGSQVVFYLTKGNGGFKVAALGDDFASFGYQVLWLVEHGRPEEARAWLDHMRLKVQPPAADDPFSGSPLARLWNRGQAGSPDDLALAGCMLLLGEKDARVTRELERVHSIYQDPGKLEQIEWARAIHALTMEQAEKAQELSGRLIASHPTSLYLASLRVWALGVSKNWQALLDFLKPWLVDHPDHRPFLLGYAQALQGLDRRQDMEQELQRQIGLGYATSSEFNNLAWSHVVRNSVQERTLEWARSATRGGGEKNSAAVHTLATVLAELGRTGEAREALVKEMDLRKQATVETNEWYVLGRIAEHLEVPDIAMSCYGKAVAMAPSREKTTEDTCAGLAKHRLDALRSKLK